MTQPKIVSLKINPDGSYTSTTRDDAKKDIKGDLTKMLAARYFSVRDAGGEGDAEEAERSRDPHARKRYHLIRDSIHGASNAKHVTHLDQGAHGYGSAPSHCDAGRQTWTAEIAKLRGLGLVCDAHDTAAINRGVLSMPDFNDDKSLVKFFMGVNDAVHEDVRKKKTHGISGLCRFIDAAPSIYVFTELLKRIPVLIEEEFTQLWARRLFPIRNLNTLLPQWTYKRYGKRGSYPQPVDTEFTPSSINKNTERVDPVTRNLLFFDNGARWNLLELERHAEAVANGAADIVLDRDRIDTAVRMMLLKENHLTFFGDPQARILGLFSPTADTGIERIPAVGLFGAGTTEEDRQLLTRTARQIFLNTEDILRPDTIMLSTLSWLFVIDKRYGDLSADNNQTVAEAALATLQKMGINELTWVPEVGFRLAEANRLRAIGIPTDEADRLAGGDTVSQQSMVVCQRTSRVMEMIVAKERFNYPAREVVNGTVEMRMLQGNGGMEFYRPEGVKIVTNIGPNTLI